MKVLNISKRILVLCLLMGTSLFFSFSVMDQSKGDWVVPDKYKNMKNPVKATQESIDIGKDVYSKHCKSCHGKYGEGDGPKAAELKTKMEDFTEGTLDKQTDGTLFYKISEGKDDMPSFKKKIQYEEDIWNVINYLRDLVK